MSISQKSCFPNFIKMVIFALFFSLPYSSYAQVDTAWVRRYLGPGSYSGSNALALDPKGFLYVTGWTWEASTLHDFATVKYNSAGDTVWTSSYNGPGNSTDVAQAIAVDSHGFVYVAGTSIGLGTEEDYATIKYDSSGNQRWVARYDGPVHGQDISSALAVDPSGNVYVTGMSQRDTMSSSAFNYATVKYDSLGNALWVGSYKGPGSDLNIALALALDRLGNAYVTGWSSNTSAGYDCATIKYNSAGDTLWVRRYPGVSGYGGTSIGRAIAVDDSGHVYVTGVSRDIINGSDFLTIKYNSAGDTLWVRRYDGPVNARDEAWALTVDSTGNVYVTGQSQPNNSDQADYLTIKYDNAGNQRWVARYNGPGNQADVAKHIAVDAQGNVYVGGGSIGLTPNGDYCTVKYDSLGSQLWAARYDGPANNYDVIFGLAIDDSNNVYVTGTSDGNVSPVMCTIKYRQFVGVEEVAPSGVSLHFELSQNVPNPWVEGTRIAYSLPYEAQVDLRVYNPVGQLVRSLVNGEESAGYKQVAWDGRDDEGRRVPSGVYFYRIQAGAFSNTRKMVLIR
jgi:uncharacterized delta-60 repeat protein